MLFRWSRTENQSNQSLSDIERVASARLQQNKQLNMPPSTNSAASLAGSILRSSPVAATSRASYAQHAVASTAPSRRNASSLPAVPASLEKGKGRVPPSQRELPLRKQYLFEQYKHLLTTSPVIVFLKPGDFSVAELTKLRVDLSLISSPSVNVTPEAINDASSQSGSKPRLMYLRPGLLRPTFKALPHLPAQAVLDNLEQEGGKVAVLVMDSLHPPTLKAALAAVRKLSSSPNVRKLQAAAAAAAAGGKNAKGGKAAGIAARPAAGAQAQEERMRVISALFDSKAASKEEVERISSLPSMEEILAQLVGLIELPARSVIRMASRAGGEDVVRTLEGFRLGLEEKEGGPQ